MSKHVYNAVFAYRGGDSPSVQSNGQWSMSNKYTTAAAGTTPIDGYELDSMKEGEVAAVDSETNWSVGSKAVRRIDRAIWCPLVGPGRMTLHFILGADTEDNGVTTPAPPNYAVPWNNGRAVDNSKVVYVNREAGATPKMFSDTPSTNINHSDADDNPYNGGVYSNHGVLNAKETFGWEGIEFIAADSRVNITKSGIYLMTVAFRIQDQATTDCDVEEVIIDNPDTGTVHLHLAGQTGGSAVTLATGSRFPTGRTASLIRAVDFNEKMSFRLRTRVGTALTAEATPNRHIIWNITRIGPIYTQNSVFGAINLSGRLI